MNRLVLVLCLITSLAAAAPDAMRYESMSLPALAAEVLGREDLPQENAWEKVGEMIATAFPSGEEETAARSRALAIKKAYPYCTTVTGSLGDPKWGLSIFRYIRRQGDTVAKEELWIYFSVDKGRVSGVTWSRGIHEY